MRAGLWAIIVVGLSVSLTMGSAAFNYATVPRAILVQIVGEEGAYLALDDNGDSPHRCFVDVDDTDVLGRISVTFDTPTSPCGAGAGTGINAGDGVAAEKYSRYAFHDILTITNKAPTALFLWVNASTTSGGGSLLDIAIENAASQMTDGDYGTAKSLSGLGPTSVTYLGIRVNSGTLTSGSVTGSIRVEARR